MSDRRDVVAEDSVAGPNESFDSTIVRMSVVLVETGLV